MDCVEAKLQIEPYVTGKLSVDEKGALESHLEVCAECRLDADLTRAAHSEPSAPASASAPPDPDPAPPSNSNWTIDSIFGAPGQPAGNGAETAEAPPPLPEPSPSHDEAVPAPEPVVEEPADDFGVPPAFTVTTTQEDSFENVLASEPMPSHEPEPEVELPAMLDDPPPSRPKSAGREISADEDDSSQGEAWDFEPADQKDGALPPEGSLFFAEEALGRSGKNGKKGKGSFAKVALWILGGVVGLGLLGVSVWIALAMRSESSPAAGDVAQHPVANETTQPGAPTPPAPGDIATTQETTPGQGAAEAPNKEATETSPTSEAMAEGPVRRTVEQPPQPSPTPKTALPPKSSSGDAPKKSAQMLAAERTARELASLPTPWRNPPPRPVRPRPVPVSEDDDFGAPAAKSTITAVKPSTSTAAKQVETPKPSASIDSSDMAAIQRTLAPPAPQTPAPSPEKPAPAPETPAPQEKTSTQAAPSDASVRPLDRLHTATLEAEQKADVEALRKLRDTWRGLARSNVGPDRARAKRELADCLWAIQTLTSRSADKKAALTAYRDYVLNAPAGGADARTVARMRQLEDALTESR